jgi:hypothetical protein
LSQERAVTAGSLEDLRKVFNISHHCRCRSGDFRKIGLAVDKPTHGQERLKA